MMATVDTQNPRAFLSYSRRDAARADEILTALQSKGIDVFKDTEDILPAEDWRGRLKGLIGSADAVVFLMSTNSVRSEVCSWEIQLSSALNKRLVPVLLEPVDEAATPPEVARLNYVFATAERDFSDAMARVASAVQTDIDWVRDHTRYGERAREWDLKARPRTALLRGGELSDAERWLAGQPQSSPSPETLSREWIGASRAASVRRQRVWVAMSLAVAALSIGLGVVAEVNRRVAEEQRNRAERILDRSSMTANDLVFDMAQRFRDRAGVPQALVKDMLGRSKALLDQLATEGEDRADLTRSRAAALTAMSVTLARQGALDAALEAAREANEQFNTLAASGAPEAAADLAVGLDREGDILIRQGDIPGAADLYRAAHEINQRIGGAGAQPAWRTNLAVSEEKLGDIALAKGDVEAAYAAFDRALAIRDSVEVRGRGAAILLEKRADTLLAGNDIENAGKAYRASLSLTRSAADAAPEDTRLMRDLSVILQKLGDLTDADEGAEAAAPYFAADLAIARELHALDEAREDWTLDLVISLDRLGGAHFARGDAQSAMALIDEASRTAGALASLDPARLDLQATATGAAQKASLVAFALGDYEKAARIAAADAKRLSPLAGTKAGGGLYADAVNNMAWYWLFSADGAAALEAAREAMALNPANSGYAINLAHALMFTGDLDAAQEIYLSRVDSEWQALIATDFAEFEGAGLGNPAISEMLDVLGR